MRFLPPLLLSVALTYVIGDLYRPHLSTALHLVLDLVICIVLYRIANHYFSNLRDG